MIHDIAHRNAEDDLLLPSTPLDLAARMRELRMRQGLKQSEVARRMGLDPSIPSLWEQGKRPVPASRLSALADALRVSVTELLEGVTDAPKLSELTDEPARGTLVDRIPPSRPVREYPPEPQPPLLTLVSSPRPALGPTVTTDLLPSPPPPASRRFVPAERPALVGWIPDGWEPGERIADISPALPDGYWLDPIRLEKPAARQLLRSRLCPADLELVGEQDVPGAALAQRIYQHCARLEGFPCGRLPVMESIFRAVLAADQGGLSVDAIIESLRERAGAVPVTRTLLYRLRDSVRPYPIRWVDRELFG